MKPPDPGPVRVLSETQETRAAATAASTALPPSRSTRAPASAVSGWPAATAPFIQGNVVSTRQTDRPVSSSEGMPVFPQVQIRALASRRSIAAASVFLAVAAVVASLAGRQVQGAVGGLEDARPVWLWAAAFCFVGSLLASSSVWRSALGLCGGRIGRTDAAACYALGSLVNGVMPVRIGEAVRLALFARRLEGDDRAWRMGGVFTVIAAMRLVVFGIVL